MVRKIVGLFLVAIVVVCVRPLFGFFLIEQVERKLDLELTSKYTPSWTEASFRLHDLKLQWKNRVEISSGDLKVDYRFMDWILKGTLRTQLSSRNLDLKLLGAWSDLSEEEGPIQVDRFFADLSFRKGQIYEIHEIVVEDPKLRFLLQPKKEENRRL